MILALLLVAVAAAPAAAQPVDHEAKGYEYAAAGELDLALAEFELAYRATSEPQLLFAMGRIHALRGDCTRAGDMFRRFLATAPGPKAEQAAHEGIDTCKPAAPAIGPDPSEGEVTPPPPPPPPVPVAPRPRRSFAKALTRDRFAQLGAVSLVAAGGLGVYGLYLSCWDGVCKGSYDDFERKRDRAPTIAIATAVAGGVGVALITTAVIRVATADDDEPGLEVSAAPVRGHGAAVTLAGRF
jgi:hypothetical protein